MSVAYSLQTTRLFGEDKVAFFVFVSLTETRSETPKNQPPKNQSHVLPKRRIVVIRNVYYLASTSCLYHISSISFQKLISDLESHSVSARSTPQLSSNVSYLIDLEMRCILSLMLPADESDYTKVDQPRTLARSKPMSPVDHDLTLCCEPNLHATSSCNLRIAACLCHPAYHL
jgi:hypothetical protein